MAGIDWFRWHHGSVTDPKFQLIARKSGARLGDVISVWAFVLEAASADTDRGSVGNIDCEAIDCLLCADDGTTAKIIEAMEVRGLIVAGRVSSWEKRQPKREREDDRSSDRVKAFRAKQREATPCNATKRQETPREEKSREDVNHSEANASAGEPAKVTDPDEIIFGYGVPLLTSSGTPEKHARSFLGGLRKQHGDAALIDKLRECIKAKPLQPIEWLGAALPPRSRGAHGGRTPSAENFESRDYGAGGLI